MGENIASGNNSVWIGNTSTASLSTINSVFQMYGEKQLVKVDVTPETVEIHYKQYVNPGVQLTYDASYTVNSVPTPTHRAIKEVYGVKDGRMQLLNTVYGRVIPSKWVPEELQYDE